MTITEKAALEGLRLSCLDQQAKGNRRMATFEEADGIYNRVLDATDLGTASVFLDHLARYPIFKCLDQWLNLKDGFAVAYPDLIANIAIDILNKEEEDESA